MMRPTIGHMLGYTALTVMLTAGAAQSLSGSDTVFSDDIVDNHVTAADLGTNSVTRTEMADNAVSRAELADSAVSSAELADNAVTGAKIANGAITGSDVNEATLVPTCPTGLDRVSDLCFDSEHTAAPLQTAMATCVAARMHLPSLNEAQLITSVAGGSNSLWADAVFVDGGFRSMRASTDSIPAGFNHEPTTNPVPYRCVTTVGARP